MDGLSSEGVKWSAERSDDAPRQQPMRQATKPIQRRQPSADQKRVRRQMAQQRKTAASPWDPEPQAQPERQQVRVKTIDRPRTEFQPREVTDDADFDPYLVTRCEDHGSKVCGDRESQKNYLAVAKAHHYAGPHDDEGMECWSCCPDMYIAKPGERESGRTASLHRLASVVPAPPCPECGAPGRDEGGMGATTFGHVDTPGHCKVWTWSPDGQVVARDASTKDERDARADAFDARIRALNPFTRTAMDEVNPNPDTYEEYVAWKRSQGQEPTLNQSEFEEQHGFQQQQDAVREHFRNMGSLQKGAPFAGYSDFDACVKANSDKDDPEAYCGYIKHKVEDSKESVLASRPADGDTMQDHQDAGHRVHNSEQNQYGYCVDCKQALPYRTTQDFKESSKTAQLPGVERAGDRECQACGQVGSPVLGDTGPACSACGSYSLLKAPHKHPGPSIDKPDYTRTSSLHEATRFETNVASADGRILINPGDRINTPTGQTITVNKVRRHETSPDHYYVDTDAGTTVVPYSTKFEMVPQNSQQQSTPDLGTPGGNWSHDPGHPQGGASNAATSTCPVCGSGSMVRQGDKYRCNRCGFTDTFVGSGAGQSFTDAPNILNPRRSARVNDHRGVIARHAAMVAGEEQETPL